LKATEKSEEKHEKSGEKLQTSGSRKLTWIWGTVHEMHSMPQKVKSCDRRNCLLARAFVFPSSWHFLGFPVGFHWGFSTGFATGFPLACCVSLELLFLQQYDYYGNVSRFSISAVFSYFAAQIETGVAIDGKAPANVALKFEIILLIEPH